MKHHVDAIGIGINCVPYQFGNGKNWLADLRYPLKVVVLDLNLECLASHGGGLKSEVRRRFA
jgi:hypothetical protein